MISLAVQDFPGPQDAAPNEADAAARSVVATTRAWLELAVVGLNLCPFAKSVQVKNQIRYAVSDACNIEDLLTDLISELQTLTSEDPVSIDTTLLIHPHVLNDFLDYNDFLDVADATLIELGLEGEIQIASFHPDYQFADSSPNAIDNYTNRSPFPVLHLLREDSVEKAVAAFPDASEIYAKNIETMQRLDHAGWESLALAFKPARPIKK